MTATAGAEGRQLSREPRPLLSIGLPVRNGEAFLGDALDSILDQSFRDFELLVVDNASRDRTGEIARAYAARDPRVAYHRNARDLGAPANFNRAFDLARGAYFKWAAHDDVLAPEFLALCVEALEDDPSAVLCHSRVRVIDARGRVERLYDVEMPSLADPAPAARFADLALVRHACYHVFGVMRREVLERTPRIGHFLGSDRVLLAELGLHGRFLTLEKHLYDSREHRERSVRIPPHERARGWFGQGGAAGLVFPYWRILREYHRAVGRAPLARRERWACRAVLGRWVLRNHHLLRGDLRRAVRDALRPGRPGAGR